MNVEIDDEVYAIARWSGMSFRGIYKGICERVHNNDGKFLGCTANVLDTTIPEYPTMREAVSWQPTKASAPDAR